MISNSDRFVQIELSPVGKVAETNFCLDTVAGRDEIADQIYKDIEEYSRIIFDDGPRSHLGASEIGHKCSAYLWFHFRWTFVEMPKGRMRRLWFRGDREEEIIIALLRGIGFDIAQVDVDGKQLRVAKTAGGHFGGSTDSRTKLPFRYLNKNQKQEPFSFQTPILLEFKTASDKWFQPMFNSGVQKANDKYWTQLCVYAYKLRIRHVLFIAVNKNNDEWNIELLEADWALGEMMDRKAEYIITSLTRPARLSENPSYFECRWCPAIGVCHFNAPKAKNCRSCSYAQPADNGEWYCNMYRNNIPKDFIPKGCDVWQPI